MRKDLFFYLFTLLLFSAKGQLNNPCSTQEASERLYLQHSVLKRNWAQIEELARVYSENAVNNVSDNNNIVIIPVVFHVVWNTPGQNISLPQLQSQLDVLNEDFRKLNADTFKTKNIFKPIAGDVRVQFCLASRAPNGDTTSGVTRTQTLKTSFSCTDSMKFTAQGGHDGWPSARYLNIWVCNLNCANGYAYYPGTGDPYDGVVIHYYVCGRTGNIYSGCKGRTGTHEVGHWMGCMHTFEYAQCNGTSPATCLGGGDKVCDTPSSSGPNYGCITQTNSCVDTPTDLPDQNENYMDYANDTCKNMFSKGQVERMRSMLFSYRVSLLTSLGCVPANTSYTDVVMVDAYNVLPVGCTGSVTPNIKIGNAGTGTLVSVIVNYSLNGNPSTQTLNVAVPSGSFAVAQLNPVSVSPGNYTIDIMLSNPNGGPDGNLQNNSFSYTFTELPPNAGQMPPLVEGFENIAFVPAGWTNLNPDNDQKWEKAGGISAFGTSSASAVFRNFYNGSTNKKDALVTPPIFVSAGSSTLSFDVSYCVPASQFYSDTLKVFGSTDCGITWTQIYAKGGASLSTAPAQTVFSEFVPTNQQWRTETASLSQFISSAVTLKFENTSFWGNDLYLDNINIPTITGFREDLYLSSNIYYNPSANALVLREKNSNPDLWIYDLSGRLLCSGKCENAIYQLPSIVSGCYIARVYWPGGEKSALKFIKID